MTHFATAALVVVTLTFAYLAFGPPDSAGKRSSRRVSRRRYLRRQAHRPA